MGKICEYTCPSCNTIWSIHIGHGMEHAILENILDVFPTEIQKKCVAIIIENTGKGNSNYVQQSIKNVISLAVDFLRPVCYTNTGKPIPKRR